MGRLLMLAHRLPYPPNKGDKIRSFNVLRHIARRHDVHLACLVDDASDLRYVDALRDFASDVAIARIDGRSRRLLSLRAVLGSRSITETHFHSKPLQETVDGWIDDRAFDGVMCVCAPMAEYVFRSRHAEGRLKGAVKVMDLIDVDSVKWAQYATESRGPVAWLYGRESRMLGRFEQEVVRRFDRTFTVSESEASLLGRHERIGAFHNGVDLAYFSPAPLPAEPSPWIVFTGVMDYRPNVDGVRWFVREVLPRVRARLPAVRTAIVGSRPTRAVMDLALEAGVTVTGHVADVRTWIARASVCVAPLRIARGIQNKVLEAMAMARAVVATPQAFEGLDARAGEHLLVESEPVAFADAVVRLIDDPDMAARMGAAARGRVESSYSWERNLAILDEVFA